MDVIENSVQARLRGETQNSGISVLSYLLKAGELIPPWWSPRRDQKLREFVINNDYLKGAFFKTIQKLTAIKPKIEPRNPFVRRHQQQAAEFQSRLLELSEGGEGWAVFLSKYLWDLFTQDNGAFIEVIGPGRPDGPIDGAAEALAVLSSSRCQRTGDIEYPVIYTDNDGTRYRLHRSRVIFHAQLPSPLPEMFGVGLCWASRAINVAQTLTDILVYKQEKLGSRPIRQLLIGRGISAEQIWEAVQMAESAMDSAGLSRYARNVVIGSEIDTNIDVDIKDLNSVPDGFDEKTSVELGMFAIALAGGIPPRDLWPATTVGATRADAMFQHLGGSATYEAILSQLAVALGGAVEGDQHLGGKFLPPQLKIIFDVVDDQQDRMQAEIRALRVRARETDLKNGVINTRVARQQALSAGDLTEEQFEELELADGRLPDGQPVLSLFTNPEYNDLLALSVGDVLNAEANREIADFVRQRIAERETVLLALRQAGGAMQFQRRVRFALAALDALRRLYAQQ